VDEGPGVPQSQPSTAISGDFIVSTQSSVSAATFSHSLTEESLNFLTHALGVVFSVMAAWIMASFLGHCDAWRVTGCSVYLASLIGLYTMSTLSHSFEEPRWRSFFRALDQGAIYLLIAGTYTPFSLAYLHSGPWWVLLALVWIVALYGFLAKVAFAHRVESVSMWPCVILAAMPLTSVPTLLGMLSIGALWWMMLGLGCYLAGLWFWLNDRRARHFHAIWHLLVVAGSACHFVGILLFVALAR
jgi:hemolysin III